MIRIMDVPQKHPAAGPFSGQCPVCGWEMPAIGDGLPECPACKVVLWCRCRVAQGVLVLGANAGVAPDLADLSTFVQSLRPSDMLPGVVVNLHDLDIVDSSFLAGLLALRRKIQSVGGKFVLCELRPTVETIVQRLQLDSLLTITATERDAIDTIGG